MKGLSKKGIWMNQNKALAKYVKTLLDDKDNTIAFLKEQNEILEQERAEWWGKADKPDEIYIAYPEHKKLQEKNKEMRILLEECRGTIKELKDKYEELLKRNTENEQGQDN